MKESKKPTQGEGVEALLQQLRGAGWVVAVHNDYRQRGAQYTFWLFTKDGRAIRGEAKTDRKALRECLNQAEGCGKALHESKELTRGDLIFFIATLRGTLVGPEMEDWEKRRILAGTSFDISSEDDEAYEEGKKRYFDSGDFAVGDEEPGSPGA